MFLGKYFNPLYWLGKYWVKSGAAAETPINDYGRLSIGVNQQPISGDDYPFVLPADNVNQLIADLYLSYSDEYCEFALPFRITWLHGFQTANGVNTDPIGGTFAHDHDILISDANAEVVFDSRDAVDYAITDWNGLYDVIEWKTDRDILRVVVYAGWRSVETPVEFDSYLEPTDAVLDSRTVVRQTPRLLSVSLGVQKQSQTALVFKNGFNTLWTPTTTDFTDGAPRETTLTLDAGPGLGRGRYSPGCEDELDVSIRRLRGVIGDERGNVTLDATACYRIERPIFETLAASPREVSVFKNRLQIRNSCGPCCECDDFLAVYEAIRKLRNRYADLVVRAQAVRDQYAANRTRFLEQQSCRESSPFRATVENYCPCRAGIAIGFCSPSDECLENVVFLINFQYSPSGLDTCGNSAASTAPNAKILANTTYRGGFINPGTRKSVSREQYSLNGSWPYYWVHFPQIQPRAQPYVTFVMEFAHCESGNVVEFVADAYAGTSVTGTTSGSPLAGYTFGQGPTTEELLSKQIAQCTIRGSASLIDECP